MPLSRVYLGVHDIGDILGGLVVGLATLYISDLNLQKTLKEKILNSMPLQNIYH